MINRILISKNFSKNKKGLFNGRLNMKLFPKRKNKNSEIENREIQACKAPKPNTNIIHARSICSGLLYSTKDSEQVVSWLDTRSGRAHV